ncbi:alpha/beta hydrolase [Neobacillus sp. WH10]|uniref:alpha/beta hydrolase n=1 Tax=Neobacillus sp. WH10 TaxID=3047873 RepID=UPI0024C11127|nr:alpha/beta hydrolase [Neobacillus sp. WH10]WHY76614.1 alpha/beta hydrolase [Neobacillus sp. WH10]
MKTTIVYKSTDSFEIMADFYPVSLKNSPVVLYIHGGGLFWGSREDMKKEQIDLYLSAGINVFSIDYRLAPETKLSEIIADIADALKWLENTGHQEFSYDPRNIAVIGSSAGAYLALMTGTFKNNPKAIVSFYGYGDITGDWAAKPSPHYQRMTVVPKELAKMLISNKVITVGPIEKRYAIYMYARQQGVWIEEISGINPLIKKDELAKYCPLQSINPEYPPTLLLHGTMDEDVPYEQSVLMSDALQTAGVENKLITIPNGKHVFDEDWQNPVVKEAFTEVIQFLRKHLG